MPDDLCIHELIPQSCTICLHGLHEIYGKPYALYRFHAKFDGVCRDCGFEWEPGDLIWKLTDGAYVHDNCMDYELVPTQQINLEVTDD